jgi:hypothetical protein
MGGLRNLSGLEDHQRGQSSLSFGNFLVEEEVVAAHDNFRRKDS